MELINSRNPVLPTSVVNTWARTWYNQRNGLTDRDPTSGYIDCIKELMLAASKLGWNIVIIPKE